MDSIPVPLVDLSSQHRALESELVAAFVEVLRDGRYVLGRSVGKLEDELSAVVGRPWVVGVSSGTDALSCALMALGIGPGDEVITTPFTFIATATAIVRLGAVPVFVDVDPVSYNLDPLLVPAALTPRTRAIIAVHLFGNPADVDALTGVAPGIDIVEDAAQALGARLGGRPVGSLGALGCFSFFPSKPLGGVGDGGAISCGTRELWERCRLLRSHGAKEKYRHEIVGGNFRLDELQAALLRVKLPHLEAWNVRRRELARCYDEGFADLGAVVCPRLSDGAASAYAQYTIRVRDGRRDALASHLGNLGIATAIHYPVPLHRQPCMGTLFAGRGAWLPEAERASREVLSLPIYPELSSAQQFRVIEGVRQYFGAR